MLQGKLLAVVALTVGLAAASVYATRLGYAPIYLTHDEVNFSLQSVSIAQTARLLAWHPDAAIATLAAPLDRDAEFEDSNFVKVVTDRAGWALYFSRAPIPWPRDGGRPDARRHIGLYAYRAGGLKAISAAPPCALEEVEKLEQLRALWLGYRIIVADAAEPPSPHVDTEEDLARIRRMLERSAPSDAR